MNCNSRYIRTSSNIDEADGWSQEEKWPIKRNNVFASEKCPYHIQRDGRTISQNGRLDPRLTH